MNLKDVSISKTEFFLRKTEGSGNDLKKLFWEDFKRIVAAMEAEVRGKTHDQTDYESLEEPPAQRGKIVPIISSPWVEGTDKKLRRFISRVFLDVFSLQIFLCEPGNTDIDDLKSVTANLRSNIDEINDRVYLVGTAELENRLTTDCICYWVEFAAPRMLSTRGDDVFEQVLGASGFKKIEMSFATIGFIDRDDELVFCILVRDVDKSTLLFNNLLAEYFLSWSKVINEEAVLKQALVENERESLNKFLGEGKHNERLSLDQLEEVNMELSDKRTAFAEKLLDVEFHLRTMEINISNAEKLFNKSLFSEQKDELTKLLIKPLRLVAEQTNAYISYYKILLEKSRITGEKIANDANLKAASYGRRLTFMFGLFSLIGILQLFSSFQQINDTDKVIILSAVILVFVIVAFRGEIKRWFANRRSE